MKTTQLFKCPLSGVLFETSHLPLPPTGSSSSYPTSPHPIFSLPLKEVSATFLPLISAPDLADWEERECLHLFGTYLLTKLPIAAWGAPILDYFPLAEVVPFWLKNLEDLHALVLRIEGKNLSYLPHFHVTTEKDGSPTLRNLKEWVKDAHLAVNEKSAPMTEEARRRNKEFRAKLGENEYLSEAHCQEIIQKGLRGSLLTKKEEAAYPALIAKWAAEAGEFPSANFRLPNGKRTTISQHWIHILTKAFEKDSMGLIDLLSEEVTPGDIEEILEHCVCNIPNDSTHAILFFKELGSLQAAFEEFKSPAKAVGAQLLALLGEAPVSGLAQTPSTVQTDPNVPRRENFSSLVAFLAAKKAYGASQAAQIASVASNSVAQRSDTSTGTDIELGEAATLKVEI